MILLKLNKQQFINLHRNIADRLLERLICTSFNPARVLNITWVDCYIAEQLASNYPNAIIYNLLLTHDFLNSHQIITKTSINHLYAKILALPLLDYSIDLVIANLITADNNLPLATCLQEIQRILSPAGLLLFTTLNSDHEDCQQILTIGDLLLQNQYLDPVIDRELIQINHQDPNKLKMLVTPIEIIYGHALRNNLLLTI